MKKIILAMLIGVSISFQLKSQGIANQSVENIDLYTGDLHYGVPLLSVSGPNGENYPISISYNSGIRLKQESSEIGLGWNINFGEITRDIKGVPDDWKGVVTTSYNYLKNEPTPSTPISYRYNVDRIKNYGPIYFKDIYTDNDNDKEMDITAQVLHDNSTFFFPAYDKYYVNTPFLNGEMSLHLFEYGTLLFKQPQLPFGIISTPGLHYDYTNPNNSLFTKKPNFRFTTDKSGDVLYNNLTSNQTYDLGSHIYDATGSHNYTSLGSSSFQKLNNPNTLKNPIGNYNLSQNRVIDGKYIEYFTNDEINSFDPSDASNNLKSLGFLDFKIAGIGLRRTSDDFPIDGIGAIQITDENGMVYHFSLPVYTTEESFKSYILNEDADEILTPKHSYKNEMRTANSWKLTAITGIDYRDVNNNGIADNGDDGYWITFDYAQWNEDDEVLTFKYPKAGTTLELKSDRKVDKAYNMLLNEVFEDKLYTMQSIVKTEIYSLNSIRTATQTALFIKDIRKDVRYDEVIDGNRLPMYYIRKILLFNNTENPYSYFGSSLGIANINSNAIYSYSDYLSNKSNIDNMTLQSVEFEHDYSLCRNYISNKNTTIGNLSAKDEFNTTSNPEFNLNEFPVNVLVDIDATTSNMNETGKLTLKSIQTGLLKGNTISNPTQFEYSDINKDYTLDQNKEDYWGYYLENITDPLIPFQSRFQNAITSQYMETWSLKKIISPLGATIQYNYEPDEYEGGLRKFGTSGIKSAGYVKGGGLRVSSVEVYEPTQNKKYKVALSYKNGNLIYEPTPLIATMKFLPEVTESGPYANSALVGDRPPRIRVFDKFIFNKYNASQFIPSNEVGYEVVITEDKGIDDGRKSGKNMYKFGNYSHYFGEAEEQSVKIEPIYCSESSAPNFLLEEMTRLLKITNSSGLRGKLLAMESYDANDKIVSSTRYNYQMINKIQEVFHSSYTIPQNGTSQGFRLPIGVIKHFYSVNCPSCTTMDEPIYAFVMQCEFYKKSTTINDAYKHTYNNFILTSIEEEKDGLKTYTSFENYKPLLGSYSTSISTDGHLSSTAKSSYAYENPLYASLGAKSVNASNKNLLNMVVSKESNPGIKSTSTLSSILNKREYNTTTSSFVEMPINNIWHQKTSSVYNLDGNIKELSELTMVNPLKYPCEMKQVNDQYSAIKYGYNNQYKLATLSNGRYGEFTYTGFEDNLIDGVAYSTEAFVDLAEVKSATTLGFPAHTGANMLEVNSGQKGVYYTANIHQTGALHSNQLEKGKYYEAMVWVKKNEDPAFVYPSINAVTKSSASVYTTIASSNEVVAENGTWSLIKLNFEIPQASTDIKIEVQVKAPIENTVYIDDFRLAPEVSSMSAYIYDTFSGQILYTLDDHNMYTRYAYDATGRNNAVYVETTSGEKLIKTSSINIVR